MKPNLDWTQAATALAGILEAENIALRAVDFNAAIALLPAKRAAIQTIESIPPDGPRQALSALVGKLDRLAAENRDLLSRSIMVQSRLLGIIGKAARAAFVFGYGSNGRSSSRHGAFTLSSKA